MEIEMEKLEKEVCDKKYQPIKNGSTTDNINRFNELKDELTKISSENIKLKNRAVDVKLLNKELEAVSDNIKKIRQLLGLESTKGHNPTADLIEIQKSVTKLLARENKK